MKTKIKFTAHTYRFDISNDVEREKYNVLSNKLKDIGFKLFDYSNYDASDKRSKFLVGIDNKEFTLDQSYIFDNQINTIEGIEDGENGLRLHFWTEPIFPNKKIKEGYYLTGDVKEFRHLVNHLYSCGFCGKQYGEEIAKEKNFLCDSCIDSEYLKYEDTTLLQLMPVSFKGNRNKVTIDKVYFDKKQKEGAISRELKAMEKLKKAMLEDRDKDIKKAELRYLVKNWLIKKKFNAFEIANTIYYNHSNSLEFNWRDSGEKVPVEKWKKFIKGLNQNDFDLLPTGITFSLKGVEKFTIK